MIAENLPKNLSGYSQAQKWYGKLREKFISEIQQHLELQQQQGIIQSKQREIEEIFLKARSNYEIEGGDPVSLLRKIMTQYIEDLFVDGSEAQGELIDVKEKVKKIKEKNSDVEKDLRKSLVGRINSTFDINKLKEILINSIQKVVKISGSAETRIRYGALIDQTMTLLWRAISEQLNAATQAYSSDLYKMAGYVKEDLEYQALLKLFDSFLKVSPGGKKSVGGQQTHMDVILSTIEEEIENFDKNFSSQIITTRSGPFVYEEQQQRELLNQIKYFGEQVKTFSFGMDSRITGGIQGLRISGQAEMFKEYTTKYPNDIFNLITNIKFVGQYRNILRSFGADTLLFSTKDGRYFMNDFISAFRKENYYLLLGLQIEKYDEAVKKKVKVRELSNTVVLDKPWYTRVKMDKKTKRKRTSWHRYAPYQNT